MPVLFHPELTADLRSAVDALRERYSAHMQRIAAKAAGALRAEAGVSADTKVLWSEAKRTAALEELAEQFRLAGLKPSQINCYG